MRGTVWHWVGLNGAFVGLARSSLASVNEPRSCMSAYAAIFPM